MNACKSIRTVIKRLDSIPVSYTSTGYYLWDKASGDFHSTQYLDLIPSASRSATGRIASRSDQINSKNLIFLEMLP